jgi:hypothetical protein
MQKNVFSCSVVQSCWTTGNYSPVAFALLVRSAPCALAGAHSPVAFAMISFDTFAGTSAYESNTME